MPVGSEREGAEQSTIRNHWMANVGRNAQGSDEFGDWGDGLLHVANDHGLQFAGDRVAYCFAEFEELDLFRLLGGNPAEGPQPHARRVRLDDEVKIEIEVECRRQ